MFAFNPTVQDRSGELIAQGMNNAATMQLQGMQSLGNALSGLGSTYADSMSKARENAIKYDTAAGKIEAYRQNADALGLDMAMLDGLDKIKDPDKLHGHLAVIDSIAADNLSRRRTEAQYNAAFEYQRQKQALGLGGGTSGTAASNAITYQF
jgi:hypothetical protein